MQIITQAGTVSCREAESATFTSPFTGRVLRKLTCYAEARGADADLALREALMGSQEPAVSFNDAGEETGRWLVRIPVYTERNGDYEYTLELTEAEMLRAERLVINRDIEIAPYEYKESLANNGGISVTCRVRTVRDVTEQLHTLRAEGPKYFPVQRIGVRDGPTEMRFGGCSWSRHDESGHDKYEIVLVERKADEGPRVRGLSGIINMQETHSAFTRELVEVLLEELVGNEVFSAADVNELKRRAEDRLSRRRVAMDEVADVDAFDF